MFEGKKFYFIYCIFYNYIRYYKIKIVRINNRIIKKLFFFVFYKMVLYYLWIKVDIVIRDDF